MSSLSQDPSRQRGKYSQKQKDDFFRLVAAGSSIRAAARLLGLNAAACYYWGRKALPPGDSAPGTPKRKYTQAQKDGFFKLFEQLGSVTEAAARLGLNRNTCYQWTQQAGLAKRRADRPTREDFHRLRRAGRSRREAAKELGIHRTTADEWDTGVRKTGNGRIYADGRVVDYNSGVRTASNVPRVPLAAVEKTIDKRFLSIEERETIRDMHASKASLRAIAARLGRPASTISRELARNSVPGFGYQPHTAQRMAAARRPRPKTSKLSADGPLREAVQDGLRRRWSPEQISKKLVTDFPDNPEMRVSPETIYQALYLQARGGLKREIQAALRTGRARRKPQHTTEQRTPRFADPMVMISERPPEIEDRAVPGHWEGDLIIGAGGKSAIATLVERATRYVMLVHLPGDHSAATVRDGLVKTMSTLPAHLRGSLTWDQGSEMAAHKSFSLATDMDVYFCDPASPWQRGSNENTNGLLRQYFPKGTDLSVHGPADLEHVAQELNGRPRKTLDWDTPAERLRDLLTTN